MLVSTFGHGLPGSILHRLASRHAAGDRDGTFLDNGYGITSPVTPDGNIALGASFDLSCLAYSRFTRLNCGGEVSRLDWLFGTLANITRVRPVVSRIVDYPDEAVETVATGGWVDVGELTADTVYSFTDITWTYSNTNVKRMLRGDIVGVEFDGTGAQSAAVPVKTSLTSNWYQTWSYNGTTTAGSFYQYTQNDGRQPIFNAYVTRPDILLVGDSIMEGSYGGTGHPLANGTTESILNNESYGSSGTYIGDGGAVQPNPSATAASEFVEHAIDWWLHRKTGLDIGNVSKGGSQTIAWAGDGSTYWSRITDRMPRVCVIECGTNDITVMTSRHQLLGAAITNMTAFIDGCRAIGIIPVVCSITPRGKVLTNWPFGATSKPAWADTAEQMKNVRQEVQDWNFAYAKLCQRKGVLFIDVGQWLVDPYDATKNRDRSFRLSSGSPNVNVMVDGVTVDQIHLNKNGCMLMASAIASGLGLPEAAYNFSRPSENRVGG